MRAFDRLATTNTTSSVKRRRCGIISLVVAAILIPMIMFSSEQRILLSERSNTLASVYPPDFGLECTQRKTIPPLNNPIITSTLISKIRKSESPLENDLPSWVKETCPGVFDHFSKVPYLKAIIPQMPPLKNINFEQLAPAPYVGERVKQARP